MEIEKKRVEIGLEETGVHWGHFYLNFEMFSLEQIRQFVKMANTDI